MKVEIFLEIHKLRGIKIKNSSHFFRSLESSLVEGMIMLGELPEGKKWKGNLSPETE